MACSTALSIGRRPPPGNPAALVDRGYDRRRTSIRSIIGHVAPWSFDSYPIHVKESGVIS